MGSRRGFLCARCVVRWLFAANARVSEAINPKDRLFVVSNPAKPEQLGADPPLTSYLADFNSLTATHRGVSNLGLPRRWHMSGVVNTCQFDCEFHLGRDDGEGLSAVLNFHLLGYERSNDLERFVGPVLGEPFCREV